MERRNWTLKSLEELTYIDSLDDELRAKLIVSWVEKYTLNDTALKIETTDFIPILNKSQLSTFLELFYKNINFLKNHKIYIKSQIDSSAKIKSFLK